MAAITPEQARQALQQRQQTGGGLDLSGGGLNLGGGGGGLGFDSSTTPMLNMLLAQSLLGGDIAAADVSALQNLGLIEKQPTATQMGNIRGQQTQIQNALADIDEAIKIIEETDKNISGRGIWAKRLLTGSSGSRESIDINSRFANINRRMRAIAGAAITGTEKALYEAEIPELGLQETENIAILQNLRDALEREQSQLLNLPGSDPKLVGRVARPGGETTTTPEQTDENLIGYTRTGQPIFSGTVGETTDSTEPTKPERPERERKGGDKPVVGGTLGGFTGGLVGSLLGPVGTVAGAGLGTGAGMAMENLIRDLTGRQTQDPLTQVQQAVGESGKSAAYAGAMELLLPLLLPKIPTARRDLFARNSPLKIGGEEVAENVINQLPGNLPVGTAGSKTVTNFVDDLINRFGGQNLSLPQAIAARSQAGKSAFTLSGQASRPVLAQLNRLLGSSLRSGIRTASPTIGLMDDLISSGLKGRKVIGNLLGKFGPTIGGVAAGAGILGKLFGQ